MTLDTSKRLGGLALASGLLVAACSSGSGATSRAERRGQRRGRRPRPRPQPQRSGEHGGQPAESAAAMTPPTAPTANVTLQGSGATFPAPLYTQWIDDYNAKVPNVQIDYQGIGSGGGIKADHRADGRLRRLGRADERRRRSQAQARRQVLHVPTALGAVVIIYNVAGRHASTSTPDTSRASSWARSRTGTTRRSPRSTRA